LISADDIYNPGVDVNSRAQKYGPQGDTPLWIYP
jgi:hypothetical protein